MTMAVTTRIRGRDRPRATCRGASAARPAWPRRSMRAATRTPTARTSRRRARRCAAVSRERDRRGGRQARGRRAPRARRPSSAAVCGPIVGSLGEAALQQRVELLERRELGQRIGEVRRRHADVRGQPLDRRRRREHPAAGQHREHRRGERVEIAATVERLAARLLGRHELGRAEHHARLRERQLRARRARRALHQLGDAEVEDLREVRIVADPQQQQVVGLDVAMDEPARVRGAERHRRLPRDVDRACRRERAVDVELALHRATIEILEHHVVVVVWCDPEIEHLDRVRGVDAQRRASLAREPLERGLVLRQVRLEQLDRDLAVHREVMRAKHGAHPAFAEHAVEPVPPIEDDPDQPFGEALGHVTLEAHAVLDAEREPVPREVRGACEAKRTQNRGAEHDHGTSSSGGGGCHRTFALGYHLVALDERAHLQKLPYGVRPVKPWSWRHVGAAARTRSGLVALARRRSAWPRGCTLIR